MCDCSYDCTLYALFVKQSMLILIRRTGNTCSVLVRTDIIGTLGVFLAPGKLSTSDPRALFEAAIITHTLRAVANLAKIGELLCAPSLTITSFLTSSIRSGSLAVSSTCCCGKHYIPTWTYNARRAWKHFGHGGSAL